MYFVIGFACLKHIYTENLFTIFPFFLFQGNYTKFLKNLHTEQLAKLALKNQNECELLEDIRQFTLKRSAIEKSYSEALLKISSAYLNKKQACIPEIKMDGADEKWYEYDGTHKNTHT